MRKSRVLSARWQGRWGEVRTKLYSVIFADPPWRFEPYSRNTGMDRAADNHYPTMTTEALCNLTVPATENCTLLMWATAPMLLQALQVMAAWGFEYRTHVVWTKPTSGTGYWFRNAHELLLLGTKGDVPAPAPGDQFLSWHEAPRSKHSEKPELFYDMINAMFPNQVGLEMFARGPRPCWDAWGNEAPSADCAGRLPLGARNNQTCSPPTRT